MSDAALERAVELVREARSVAVVSHRDPDGDTIGAAVALGLALEGAGTRVTYHCADAVPDAFRFLPTAARYTQDPPRGVDLVVTLDLGDLSRARLAVPEGVPLLNIDHHATNSGFGTAQLVDATSAATAEVVARVIDAAGLGWTPEMATAALLAIMTDTGSFQFSNTDPRVHRLAARLLEAGADLQAVTTHALRTRPFGALRLFGVAFTRLESELEGRLVHTWITAADRASAGARPEDASGLVEQIARSKGMRVAVLFNGESPDAVKVSVRTSPEPPAVDAALIASRFGGGGHVRAAGAVVAGPLDEVRSRVLAEARAALA